MIRFTKTNYTFDSSLEIFKIQMEDNKGVFRHDEFDNKHFTINNALFTHMFVATHEWFNVGTATGFSPGNIGTIAPHILSFHEIGDVEDPIFTINSENFSDYWELLPYADTFNQYFPNGLAVQRHSLFTKRATGTTADLSGGGVLYGDVKSGFSTISTHDFLEKAVSNLSSSKVLGKNCTLGFSTGSNGKIYVTNGVLAKYQKEIKDTVFIDLKGGAGYPNAFKSAGFNSIIVDGITKSTDNNGLVYLDNQYIAPWRIESNPSALYPQYIRCFLFAMLSKLQAGESEFLTNFPNYNESVPTSDVEWHVQVDDEKNRDINVFFRNEFYEGTNNAFELRVAYGDIEDFKDIGTVMNGYLTSYGELLKICDEESYNAYLRESLENPLDMYLIFNCESFNTMSSMMYVKIPFAGDIEDYGNITTVDDSYIMIEEYTGESSSGSIDPVNPNPNNLPAKFKEDDPYKPFEEESDTIIPTTPYSALTLSGMTQTIYIPSASSLINFATKLWGSFINDLKLTISDPMEGIISLKALPFINHSSIQGDIYLSGVNMNTSGYLVNQDWSQEFGPIHISPRYFNFLDFHPYTNITIFLPFIGYHTIDVNKVMDKDLSVKYNCDIITGMCQAIVYADGVPFQTFDGTMGIEIPLLSTNANERVKGLLSGVTGGVATFIAAAATGVAAPVAALGGTIAGLNVGMAPTTYDQKGVFSAQLGAMNNRTIFIVIDRPQWQLPNAFNHSKGRALFLTKHIGSLKGFTACDPGVDLTGLSCTQSERDELRTILSTGFYA